MVGRARMAWQRRDVRAHTTLARRESAAVITAAEQAARTTGAPGAAGDR